MFLAFVTPSIAVALVCGAAAGLAAGFGLGWVRRRKVESQLRASQQLIASITANLSEGIYRSSPRDGMLYVNQAYLRMFGYGSLEELRAVPREKLYVRAEDRRRLLTRLERDGGFVNQEIEFRRRDGSSFWGVTSGVALYVPGSQEIAFFDGFVTDVTERREAEEEVRRLNADLERRIAARTDELRESEARARILVEHAPEAIVVFDAITLQFVNVNQNAVRLFGRSREELLRLGPAEVSPPTQPDGRPSAQAARDMVEQALSGELPVFDWMHQSRDGRLRLCEIRLVRLPAEGRPLLRASITDNTERRRREQIQEATFRISQVIHTADDLDSLFRQVHAIIRTLMPADNFYIALRDPFTELVHFPYFVDEKDEHPAPLRITTGLTGYVLRTGTPLLADRETVARKRPVQGAVLLEGLGDLLYEEAGSPAAVWLGVPLIVGGQTFGVMAVQDYENADTYGAPEKQILNFVGEQTALAISRKQAENDLQRRNEQIRCHRNALLELALIDKTDFEAATTTICGVAADAMELARVSYWCWNGSSEEIRCEILHRLDRGGVAPEGRELVLGSAEHPAYFEALASKRPIVASRAAEHPATASFVESYLRPNRIASMLDVPVWLDGKLLGVLCQEHVGDPRQWTAEEIDFASSLATMISLAAEAASRARSEAALRESEEKHRALFEATSQGVLLHDEARILEANPAAARILGFPQTADLVGRHPAGASSPIQPNGEPSAELAQKHIQTALQSGSNRFEWLTRRPDGMDLPIEVFLTAIPVHGRCLIQAVIQDISDRKKAEEELLRALAKEKQLSQLKSQFVTTVSHEFRTPLGIILSSAEILDSYFERLSPPERREHLLSIQRNTRRMAELMEEVLLLGKVEAGKMQFEPVPILFHDLCRQVVRETQTATKNRCPIEYQPGLTPSEAVGDERLLRLIFGNVLSNAVKYSPPGRPVLFEMTREEEDVVCRIVDQGIGIPEPDQTWLFHAFHRGQNVAGVPGSGLGLVIVKRVLDLHGGSIRLQSTPGQGTTVTVRLPLYRPVGASAPAAASTVAASSTTAGAEAVYRPA